MSGGVEHEHISDTERKCISSPLDIFEQQTFFFVEGSQGALETDTCFDVQQGEEPERRTTIGTIVFDPVTLASVNKEVMLGDGQPQGSLGVPCWHRQAPQAIRMPNEPQERAHRQRSRARRPPPKEA